MSGLSPEFVRAFELGRKEGRKDVIDEIIKALDLDERIATAIARHEQHFHNVED